jgi:uncharacterized protein (DUF1800 family)
MARDSQAALVALNRFGFGARGGASGDFVNAASDPRGFVKAELARPSGVLLEVPGLLSTPALVKAVFAYQFEIQQARDAAAKMPVTEANPSQPAADTKAQRRNLSLNSIAMDMSPKEPAMQARPKTGALKRWRRPRRCSPMRPSRRRSRSTSSRRPTAPRRWRGCSAP